MKNPYERNVMSTAKQKFEDVKAKTIQFVKDRPLESAMIASVALTTVAKVLNAISAERNSKAWRREVQRRERKTYQDYTRR
jgi:hypothetical protein